MRQEPKTIVRVIAHPNRSKSGVVRKDDWSNAWHFWVKSKAQKNEANSEIEKLCSRIFGTDARIVSGKTSSRKVLEVFLEQAIVEKKLEEALIV